MGAVWSEQRKLDNWLEVELAVVDELAEASSPGDRRRRRSASARRSRSRRSRSARRSPTTTSRRSSTSSPPRWASEGRWIHYGLTSSDVLDTALGLQLKQAGVILVAGRAGLPRRARTARARARGHDLRRPHARHPGRADDLRREARRASRSRPSATCAGCEGAVKQASVGALSGAVGTYAANGPELEAAVLDAARARARGRLDAGGRARPARAAPERDRARGRRPRALRHRGPPPPAHRGARGRGAVPRGPEGLVGDAAQAQPDRVRAHLRHRAPAARLRAGRARERRALARARHLALVRGAGRAARRVRSCSTTRSTWRSAWSRA